MSDKKPYHRDDLRGDLLAAGRDYVGKHGHLGLSMRTLAQTVGVSPGAPYHHFPDRRAFLLALAIEGFREMTAGAVAIAESDDPSAEKLKQMGLVFIRFADDNPHLIDLMYESELTSPTLDPQLLEFQVTGHNALRGPIIEAAPGLSDEEVDLRAVAYWAAIYGFSSMRRKGVLHPHKPDLIPSVDIADAIVDRSVRAALAD